MHIVKVPTQQLTSEAGGAAGFVAGHSVALAVLAGEDWQESRAAGGVGSHQEVAERWTAKLQGSCSHEVCQGAQEPALQLSSSAAGNGSTQHHALMSRWDAGTNEATAHHRCNSSNSAAHCPAIMTLILLHKCALLLRCMRCSTGKAAADQRCRVVRNSLQDVLAAFTRPPAAHSVQLVAPLLLWYRCRPCTTPLQRLHAKAPGPRCAPTHSPSDTSFHYIPARQCSRSQFACMFHTGLPADVTCVITTASRHASLPWPSLAGRAVACHCGRAADRAGRCMAACRKCVLH